MTFPRLMAVAALLTPAAASASDIVHPCAVALNPGAPVASCMDAQVLGLGDGCYELNTPTGTANTLCDFLRVLVVPIENGSLPHDGPAAFQAAFQSQVVAFMSDASYGRVVVIPTILFDTHPVTGADIWWQQPGVPTKQFSCSQHSPVAAKHAVDYTQFDMYMTVYTSGGEGHTGSSSWHVNETVPDVLGDCAAGVTKTAEFLYINQPHMYGVMNHEMGHGLASALGLTAGANVDHARYESSRDGQLASYGDHTDTMGLNDGHFSAALKDYLDWLPISTVQLVPTTQVLTTATVEALEPRDQTTKTVRIETSNVNRNMSLEVRRLTDQTVPGNHWDDSLSAVMRDGALIKQVSLNGGPWQTTLLDGTPETPSHQMGDATILPGRTYTIHDEDIHISVASSDPGEEGSALVVINRGAPVSHSITVNDIVVTASACCGGAAGTCVELTADVTDSLHTGGHHFWRFENGTPGAEYHPNYYAYGQTVCRLFAPGDPMEFWLMYSDGLGCEAWEPYALVPTVFGWTESPRTVSSLSVSSVDAERVGGLRYRMKALDSAGVPLLESSLDAFPFHWWDVPALGVTSRLPEAGLDFAAVGPGSYTVNLALSSGPFECGVPGATTAYAVAIERQWTNPAPTTPQPALEDAAMVFDMNRRKVVMFGGSDGTTTYDTLWEFDATLNAWSQVLQDPGCASLTVPSPRYRHAMALWRGLGGVSNVVLYGGRDLAAGTQLDDTWVWDGTCWTEQFPVHVPPARANHMMATDRLGQVVLYGGRNGPAMQDTWVWDGSDWEDVTSVDPLKTPPLRSTAMMAFDEASKYVILFGGKDTAIKGDMWQWDGVEWSQVTPASLPPGRQDSTLVHDPRAGVLVLFGGDDVTTKFNETWEWDGAAGTWVDMTGVAAPTARSASSAAYDLTSGQIVLFGGEDTANVTLGDTWVSAQ